MNKNSFISVDPTLEEYWRTIILFGRNTSCYKFSLATALLQNRPENSMVKLEDLALPFAQSIVHTMQDFEKQTTAKNSQYLQACLDYKNGKISQTQLQDITIKKGFVNVIDAFHNVAGGETDKRFFTDMRKTDKAIQLTDNFYELLERLPDNTLENETFARWRLVNYAWETNVNQNLLHVHYDNTAQSFYSLTKERRVNLSSSHATLNGYQKGHCFYCFDTISISNIAKGTPLYADVDHFFPYASRHMLPNININSIWNLVLSCQECNRGQQGEFDKIPHIDLLTRLHNRNEYLIDSHLPIKETLLQQTGKNEQQRIQFLNMVYNILQVLPKWKTTHKKAPLF